MAVTNNRLPVALRLAGPVFAEELYSLLLSAVITGIVGNLGAAELAAFNLAALVQGASVLILGFAGTGTAILAARWSGAGNWPAVKQLAGQTLGLGLPGGMALCLAGMLVEGFFRRFFAADIISLLVAAMLKPLYFFAPFLLVIWLTKCILRGVGETRLAFLITAVSNTVMLACTTFFVYGLHPGQGLRGAVWGLGAGEAAGAAAALYFLAAHPGIRLRLQDVCLFRPEMMKKIAVISLPVAWEQTALQLGFTLYSFELVNVGAEQLAGSQIAQQLEAVPLIIGSGLSVAAMTVVGQSLGKNLPRIADEFARFLNRLCVGAMTLCGLIVFCFCRPLIGLFTVDPETADWAIFCTFLSLAEQPTMAVEFILGNALRGAGETRWPAYSSVAGMWLVRLPLTYYLIDVRGHSIAAAWLITAADHLCRSAILAIKFYRGNWKKGPVV